MSQNNLFTQPNFQSSPFTTNSLFQPDMTMQFAPSVPHRRPSRNAQQQQQLPVSFHNPHFQNQEILMQQQQLVMQPFSSSPYNRHDSVGSTATSKVTGKQFQTKADRRAEHNATERLRREHLNVKFQQLAFTLPNLQNDTRPSKSIIIDRTLDFVKNAIAKEERYEYRIRELERFNQYLLNEAQDRMKRKKTKKNATAPPTATVRSASTSPVAAPALILSPSASTEKVKNGSVVSENEEYDDEDEEYGTTDHYASTDEAIPMFTTPTKPNNAQEQPFLSINGAPNHNNNNNLLPVSQPTVSMMPTKQEYCTNNIATNGPMTMPFTEINTHQQYIKEEQQQQSMPFFQSQQQTLMIQKFQDHTIASTDTEQEDDGFNSMSNSPIFNNYSHHHMLSNNNTDSFMAPIVMMEPEHRHIMHRR